MAKLIIFDAVTINCFYAGANDDISWHRVDEEFNDFAIDQLKTAGALMFGRRTYQMMASYWPTDEALNDDQAVAQAMNSIKKYVVSNSIENTDWNNTTLLSGDIETKIRELKSQHEQDIFIFGSGILTQSLINMNLVDEIRLMSMPIVLSEGKPLFENIKKTLNLELIEERTFQNGNVLTKYKVLN